MVKSPTHAPKHVCANFPLCAQLGRYTRHEGTRVHDRYCDACLALPTCSEPACNKRVMPRSVCGADLCRAHSPEIGDIWAFCCNSGLHDCQHLSVLRLGGPCYACSSGNLPCCHAAQGCANHVRNNSLGLLSCTGDNRKCPFHLPRCIACNLEFVEAVGNQICSTCASGQTQCIRGCGRRAMPGNGSSCANVFQIGNNLIEQVCLSNVSKQALATSCWTRGFPKR